MGIAGCVTLWWWIPVDFPSVSNPGILCPSSKVSAVFLSGGTALCQGRSAPAVVPRGHVCHGPDVCRKILEITEYSFGHCAGFSNPHLFSGFSVFSIGWSASYEKSPSSCQLPAASSEPHPVGLVFRVSAARQQGAGYCAPVAWQGAVDLWQSVGWGIMWDDVKYVYMYVFT